MSKIVHCSKKRRRTKELVKSIQEQVEFYFSDANLNRDKFLQKLVGCDGTAYVSLDVLLKFNLLQRMETNEDLLQRALKNSECLQLNKDLKAVKRKAQCIKPLPSDLDEHTIVIDGLPPNATLQWLKAVCSKFGSVSYISLPRFKSDSIKGIAFIEYVKVEDAVLACSVLNSPPPNFFPKLLLFENRFTLQFHKTNFVAKLNKYERSNSSRNMTNRIENQSKDFQKNSSLSVQPELMPACMFNSSKNLVGENDNYLNNICVKQESNLLLVKLCSNQSYSDHVAKLDKSHLAKHAMENNLPFNKCKRSAAVPLNLYEEKYAIKIPRDSGNENAINHLPENSFQNVYNIKRKRKHREKSLKGKVNKESNKKICLHAMMKTDWVENKKSYMHHQRENFGKLKSILQKCSSPDPETASVYIKHHLALKRSAKESFMEMSDPETEDKEKIFKKIERPQISSLSFVPGVVVSLSSLPANDKSDTLPSLPHFTVIKSYFKQYGRVAYVDVKPGSAHGYVRFETSEAAQSAIMEEKRYGLCLLTSVQEEKYWDKLLIDRQLRRTRERNRVRGKKRLILRAQKRTDTSSTRHIRFSINFQ